MSVDEIWIFICLAYLGGHFAFYVAVGRNVEWMRSEKCIFLYHALSFAFACLVSAVGGLTVGVSLPVDFFFGTVFAHAIYSLSFLELWALADDSFSLAILRHLLRYGEVHDAAAFQGLASIGVRKQRVRLKEVLSLGLVRSRGEQLVLTNLGRFIAGLAVVFLRIPGIKRFG